MNALELADAMEIRASIRRKATSRKSVTEGANDRLADQLDQAATMLRQQQAEIEALKSFVKPILAHGDDCVGDWDGGELQDLAVKTGLLIEVEKTQFCNLDKEEFIGCPCREYHYDEESWICLNTAKFLLDKAQEK